MNGQLQQAVAELIKKSMSTMEGATSFLYAELPDVVHQLLLWKSTESAISFIICIAIGCLIALCCKWLVSVVKGKEEADDEIMFPGTVIVILIPFCGMAYDIAWLQILIAPKVYLLEYASQLLK